MTSNEDRATTLVRALRAGIEGDEEELRVVFTDDVRAWTPVLSTASVSELIDELARRDDAFSDIVLDVTPLDVGGDHACVEWTVDMTHTGTITLADDQTIEPSDIRVTLHGVTVAGTCSVEPMSSGACSVSYSLTRATPAPAPTRPS